MASARRIRPQNGTRALPSPNTSAQARRLWTTGRYWSLADGDLVDANRLVSLSGCAFGGRLESMYTEVSAGLGEQ
jgi:hypothetical protein